MRGHCEKGWRKPDKTGFLPHFLTVRPTGFWVLSPLNWKTSTGSKWSPIIIQDYVVSDPLHHLDTHRSMEPDGILKGTEGAGENSHGTTSVLYQQPWLIGELQLTWGWQMRLPSTRRAGRRVKRTTSLSAWPWYWSKAMERSFWVPSYDTCSTPRGSGPARSVYERQVLLG